MKLNTLTLSLLPHVSPFIIAALFIAVVLMAFITLVALLITPSKQYYDEDDDRDAELYSNKQSEQSKEEKEFKGINTLKKFIEDNHK